MTRVGILGCASIAKRSLAPAFMRHDGFELVAVASRSANKATEFAEGFSARGCTYDELVQAPDVDLIYCPLPTGLHHNWVAKSLEAGKHVLCEKSLGTSLREVEDLVGIARERQLFLMESFQFRFHAQNLYVKSLLAGNAIGPVRDVVVRFGIPPFPEGAANIRYSKVLGGGALLDNGAYAIKAATYLLGHEIEVLAAMHGGETNSLGNVDLTGSIMMRTPSGVSIHGTYGFDHYYQNGYEIWGKDGKISTTRAFTARGGFAAPVIVETASGKDVKTFDDDHFARLLDYVASTIATGDFEREYSECIVQARTVQAVKEIMK